jgi:uncharacterized protein YkwD
MEPPGEPRKSHLPAVVAAIASAIIVIILVFVILSNLPYLLGLASSLSSSTRISLRNPSISSGSLSITYPPDYSSLENYSLSIINSDRQASGLPSVVGSPIPSAQQHADSMLYYGYFSHWDTQGFKPYMRYSLLNGTGFVDENVAFEQSSLPSFVSTASVENALYELEYQMMNNDSQCCQNGHRDNILSPYHNRVSIGVAYDSTHVYFVEDFENYYTTLGLPLLSSDGSVTLKGNTSTQLSPVSVLVFYDSQPTPLNASTLNSQYDGPYTQGTFTGGVIPPCTIGCEQFPPSDCPSGCVTVSASTWQTTNSSIDIQFSITNFVQNHGSGVYTFYIEQGSQSSPEYITSLSVFVTSG